MNTWKSTQNIGKRPVFDPRCSLPGGRGPLRRSFYVVFRHFHKTANRNQRCSISNPSKLPPVGKIREIHCETTAVRLRLKSQFSLGVAPPVFGFPLAGVPNLRL